MWAAEKLVPPDQRPAWRGEWVSGLWTWTLGAAATGARDARMALWAHTRRAAADAVHARDWGRAAGSPGLCCAVACALFLAVAIETSGFPAARRILRGLPYRQPDKIVLLAQGPPVLGIRLGLVDEEMVLFRQKSKTLEAVATYGWHTSVFGAGRGAREIIVASVGQDFFSVLGLPNSPPGPDQFLVTEQFWNALGGSKAPAGRWFMVGGKPMQLAGVLPRGFWFLSEPPPVWTLAQTQTSAPQGQWWLRLKGAVARLRPGVRPSDAEKELRQILIDAKMARRNFQNYATPIRSMAYQSAAAYGSGFLVSMGALIVWALFGVYRDGSGAARFWGFFAAKAVLPLLGIFLFAFETTNTNTFAMATRAWWGRALVWQWACFCLVALVCIWAWRDQSARCRICLRRLHRPLRIGVPGRILLDTAGEEVMCPEGHGSVYTSSSVLGAEISKRWLGMEEIG